MQNDHITVKITAFIDMEIVIEYFFADCSNLTAPSNGQVSLISTAPGSLATYTCDNGYMLIGDANRQCQIDRTWSQQEPVCESKLLYLNYFIIGM